MRRVARELGMQGHQAQAIAWMMWRELNDPKKRRKLTLGGKTGMERYMKGVEEQRRKDAEKAAKRKGKSVDDDYGEEGED
jgi:hypothetical protein